MKYIMFEVSQTQGIMEAGLGRKLPILFPDEFVHRDIARCCMPLLRNFYPHVKLSNAGFFDTRDGETKGKSESLGLASRPEDAELILNFDSTKGF